MAAEPEAMLTSVQNYQRSKSCHVWKREETLAIKNTELWRHVAKEKNHTYLKNSEPASL